ncbi:MAG: class II glutamine amidotransferase [Pseudomonadota bacterium]
MCRFVYYLGPRITLGSLVTEPDHSLIHQSYHAREREEPLNGDGFGVAWYDVETPDYPVVFKEVMPAWSSINLYSLAPTTRSHCLLAHIRAATPGLAVTQLNCHPFRRGRLSFMHNGEVAGFRSVRRRLLAELSDEQYQRIESTGDSEVVFALAMDRLADLDHAPNTEDLAGALLQTSALTERVAMEADLGAPSYLNLVLTDGHRAAITRYVTPGGEHRAQTLYYQVGSHYRCENGICMMDDVITDERTILVSSEPLSEESGWKPVPVNHVLLIDRDRDLELRPIETPRSLAA